MKGKRNWKVIEDSGNSLVIQDEHGEKMCELVSEEDTTTDAEKARMEWIKDACNAYKRPLPQC